MPVTKKAFSLTNRNSSPNTAEAAGGVTARVAKASAFGMHMLEAMYEEVERAVVVDVGVSEIKRLIRLERGHYR